MTICSEKDTKLSAEIHQILLTVSNTFQFKHKVPHSSVSVGFFPHASILNLEVTFPGNAMFLPKNMTV
jgi:hypothetical protein